MFNLFADPDIIRLPGPLAPLQNIIASFIAKRRAPKSRAAYESIGGGSPILKYTNAQAKLLRESFSNKYGMPIQTYVGMRYWKPYTDKLDEEDWHLYKIDWMPWTLKSPFLHVILRAILNVILTDILSVIMNVILTVILNVILNAEINGTWLEVIQYWFGLIISPRKVCWW